MPRSRLITVRLSGELLDKLDEYIKKGYTQSEVVREALKVYFFQQHLVFNEINPKSKSIPISLPFKSSEPRNVLIGKLENW